MDFVEWARKGGLFSEKDVQDRFEAWFGAAEMASLAEAMRHPPSQTTLRPLRVGGKTSVAAVLATIRERVGGRKVDRHPCIDDCIVIEPTPKGGTPRVPRVPNSVVVDVRCGEAVLRGADIFAPGILATTSRFEVGAQLNVLVAVDDSCTPLKGSIVDRDLCGPESEVLIHIGVGEAAMSRADIVKQGSSGTALRLIHRLVDHPPMDAICESTATILQNVPSMVPPLLLRPASGERVIDMCAAPGGKTVHLASLMNDTGAVVALDRSAKRLESLKELALTRAEMTCIEVVKHDATKAAKKWPPGSFDAVLLDPPCSGLGLRPKLRHDVTTKQLEEFASYQRRLMVTAFDLAKPGGRIVYSTCTISPLENEGNVAWFLSHYADKVKLRIVNDATRPLYELGSPGLPNVGLTEEACKNVIRFTPTVDSPHIGFFVAVFDKVKQD
ncbi:tRNA (cytosine(48)-C(5))-methyltransferase [Diplonema papillatum]|nr:tRNA (cytosine(48)-C(5))-methyltransferase [Diplonema papillatum]